MKTMTILEAVTDALDYEMGRDDRVLVLGEDVGLNGGVFRATQGLQEKYGEERCFDTPLSECGIIGTAIGMALYGLRPVPEIQFMDFIYPAFDQIVSEAAKMRYRSGGEYSCPMVIRTPYGGGIRGGHYHSQSAEAYFTHTPGIKVVIPSTPADTKGLLISAIRDEDPVLFMEPKRLYRATKGEVPKGEHIVPLGKGRIVREGTDCTVVAWGAMIDICEKAADEMAKKGRSIEIVDPRTLVPLDEKIILDSVKKTGRFCTVYEAPKTGGFGGEIATIVAEKAIEYLEGPISRVAGFDVPFPYTLEGVYMPDVRRVVKGIEKTFDW